MKSGLRMNGSKSPGQKVVDGVADGAGKGAMPDNCCVRLPVLLSVNMARPPFIKSSAPVASPGLSKKKCKYVA